MAMCISRYLTNSRFKSYVFWLPAWWALWLLWWPLTDAAMFQCVYGYLQSVFFFLVLFHCCILLEIKLTTTIQRMVTPIWDTFTWSLACLRKVPTKSLYYRLDISWWNIIWYWTKYERKKAKTSFRLWTHKRRPMPRCKGRAVGRIFWVIWRNDTTRYCTMLSADYSDFIMVFWLMHYCSSWFCSSVRI